MDDMLSIKKIPYIGTALRIDGYYYNEYIPGHLTIYFFYRDGTVLYGSSPSVDELISHESSYRDGKHYHYAKNLKYYWGVYKVDGTEILFERWYPSQPPLKAYIRSGVIINDTSFHIKEFKSANGSVIETRNETYHFKQFSPKPDSTNNFIK